MTSIDKPRAELVRGWVVLLALLGALGRGELFAADVATQASNRGFRLQLRLEGGVETAALDARLPGLRVADGPYFWRAARKEGNRTQEFRELENATIERRGDRLTVRGQLARLELEDHFFLPGNETWMEERIVVRNRSRSRLTLSEFEAGFQRRVTDSSGEVLAELRADRWTAVPLRVRADDPAGFVNDFSIHDLVSQPGYEPWMDASQHCSRVPSRHRRSEGWAWTHGNGVLGIYVFNQQNMLFSVVSVEPSPEGKVLRFGGACMISGEPDALARIEPGQSVDLGTVRYEALKGGYPAAEYAFRAMLDAKGCRFPADYDPPVHWEQLYDMPGAWDDRLHLYTKAILEKEAAKAVAFHCEALYLDPGWDTSFGSFLWGEEWLGPRRAFIREMQSKFGLKVSLHCPLATWISVPYTMGPSSVGTWPKAARREIPSEQADGRRVPAVRERHRNLALLPSAKANASSVYQNGAMPIHQIAHLNDGWYGNSASWIADTMPAWAEIDLGGVFQISKVCLGNDHAGQFSDRAATGLRILVATTYQPDWRSDVWRTVAQYEGPGLLREKTLEFAPVAARWVRVELFKSGPDMPRLDEIEVYEATPVSAQEAESFAKIARRGPEPASNQPPVGLLCLGSRQYRAEAAKRLLANCADGVAFLMYDGNWWNGGCSDTNHGHPVPYLMEDHVRANLDLARRVHKKFPKVLIEQHDPIAGGSPVRFAPVYYKYGLPGSYDENWGFELMWNSMADLKEGRARSLYYYNLGCNVPIYLHVNLSGDNEQCVLLWWYASTCRNLGIGGTSRNPAVVKAQQAAMAEYAKLERFFKRGDFFGINEEIHLHVLAGEKAFAVNLFNLSNAPRLIQGSIGLKEMGLDPQGRYSSSSRWGTVKGGEFAVSLQMPPWSAEVAEFHAASQDQ